MSIGKPLKPGFLATEAREGTFLSGTVKQYGNNKGVARKAMQGKLK